MRRGLAILLCLPLALAAQEAPEELPGVDSDFAPVTAPAAPATPAAPAAPVAATPAAGGDRLPQGDGSGTVIVGERESPIGLYITPWRNAYAEKDIDRPARLLQVDMLPIDEDVFIRQIEYHNALSKAAAARRTPPPAAAPAAP